MSAVIHVRVSCIVEQQGRRGPTLHCCHSERVEIVAQGRGRIDPIIIAKLVGVRVSVVWECCVAGFAIEDETQIGVPRQWTLQHHDGIDFERCPYIHHAKRISIRVLDALATANLPINSNETLWPALIALAVSIDEQLFDDVSCHVPLWACDTFGLR